MSENLWDFGAVLTNQEDRYSVEPYAKIHNWFFDALMADLSGAEVKVFLYIARHIWGYERCRKTGSDQIGLAQFVDGIINREGSRRDRGTGLSRPSVIEALCRLEARGLVKRNRGKGRTADTWVLPAILPEPVYGRVNSGSKNFTATGQKT